MKKRTLLVTVLAVLLVGWMAFIFMLSCEDGDKSGQTSKDVATEITEIVMPSKPVEETEKIIEKNHKTIRKGGHFLVYMVLGVLSAGFLSSAFELKSKDKMLVCFAFCAFYAATDELHQFFVAGRSGMAEDVCLDSVSAFVGIVLMLMAEKVYRKMKAKRLYNS